MKLIASENGYISKEDVANMKILAFIGEHMPPEYPFKCEPGDVICSIGKNGRYVISDYNQNRLFGTAYLPGKTLTLVVIIGNKDSEHLKELKKSVCDFKKWVNSHIDLIRVAAVSLTLSANGKPLATKDIDGYKKLNKFPGIYYKETSGRARKYTLVTEEDE